MPTGDNRLGPENGPLFFRLADAKGSGLAFPENRLGDALRVAVTSLGGMQKEAIVVSARTGIGWRFASDEGAYLDGHDAAPCPLSFLSTGMVSSYMNELLALAEQRGIAVRNVRLIQDNYYTMKGSALKGTMTGGARDIDLEAQIDADADPDTLRNLTLDAVTASPLNGLMRESRESLFSLTHNGHRIDNARALPVAGPVPPEPSETFAAISPAPGDWSGLITHLGRMTPRNENTRTFAGGSLADEQDRLLQVRVHCTLTDDGMKEIVQYLYNPHGSVFRYLCEEAPENGGKGRAPDAASYIAAGIGFCFMTQLGRYAKIVRRPLAAYSIVQDAHFSLGGASGGTGEAGAADPLETHLYLHSAEDDAYAQSALDMSEQTCFLHAFCKANLRARVKVSPFDQSLVA